MMTFGLDAGQQDEVWAWWRQGESQRMISRRMGINRPATVRGVPGLDRRSPPAPTPPQRAATAGCGTGKRSVVVWRPDRGVGPSLDILAGRLDDQPRAQP